MKTKSINEFEKGDIITRIEPVQYPEDSIYGNLKDPKRSLIYFKQNSF